MDNSEEITDCTLFVGDLSREVSREDLYNLFEMIGEVQEAVVKCSNVTGQPMGYGFVRMATRDDAEHALQALAGMNLKGRCIRVGRAERNCRLIVKNLDRSVRFEDLLHIFLPYGSLQMYDSGQEVSVNGFCARILHFVRRADAERAKRDLHMQIFHGRPMHVEWYRHTPEDQISGDGGHAGRNEPVVSVHVRFMTIEHDVKVDEHMLYHVFKKYGEVTKISIKAMIQDKDTNLSRGYAFVHFSPTLDGCQSALEAASAMDDVMYNGVHFFSKPSQNFHRAHEELIRQENQQSFPPQQHQHQSIPSRRFSDSLVSGRIAKHPPPPPPSSSLPPPPRHPQQFLRINNSQHYPSTGRGPINNLPSQNSSRYYDESQKSYPRIMQYQHEQSNYTSKNPYPYQDYLLQMNEIDNGISRGHSSWPSNGYPKMNEFNPEDSIFGHNDIIHGRNNNNNNANAITNAATTASINPSNTNLRRDGRDKMNVREGIPSFNSLGGYSSQSVNEPLWSSNQQQQQPYQQQQQHMQHIQNNQNIYSQSNYNSYPPTYSTKDIFPQEYSEQGLARYDQFQVSSSPSLSNQSQIHSQSTNSNINININTNTNTNTNMNRSMGRHLNSAQMESGLNIEASAFLPTNNQRPGRQMNHMMMHLPGGIPSLTEHQDLYNSNLEQNGPSKQYRSISIDNSRISTSVIPQENVKPLNNKIIMEKNNEDLQAGNFSDLLDRSLSSEAEHSHPHPHTHILPVEEDNHEY